MLINWFRICSLPSLADIFSLILHEHPRLILSRNIIIATLGTYCVLVAGFVLLVIYPPYSNLRLVDCGPWSTRPYQLMGG